MQINPRTVVAQLLVVATLTLSAVTTWAVTGAMSQTHGVMVTTGK